MNNKYIYIWKVDETPIYVGQGSHNRVSKYRRATDIHIFSNGSPSLVCNNIQRGLDPIRGKNV